MWYQVVSCSVTWVRQFFVQLALTAAWVSMGGPWSLTVFGMPHLLTQLLSSILGRFAVLEWEFHGEPELDLPLSLAYLMAGYIGFASIILGMK